MYPEIEAAYRKLLRAARRGPEAVRRTIEKLRPGTSDWRRTAWDILEARQKGRPEFLFKDPKSGGFLHWSPEEGVLRRILNAGLSALN